MLNGLDLFSGISGFSDALGDYIRVVAYCERDRKRQRILLSRQLRGEIDRAPIWTDVTTLRGSMLPEIDIITAGFPCTNISLAGNREGLAGVESQLFWQVVRIAKETSAPIIFLENVWPGIRKHIPTIRDAFESMGYECRDGVISASEVGARHKRARWFMLAAHTNRLKMRIQSGRRIWSGREEKIFLGDVVDAGKDTYTYTHNQRVSVSGSEIGNESEKPFGLSLLEGNNWDEYAGFFLRVDHGLPYRSDRIGALGGSVVPLQARTAFKRLAGIGDE